MGTRTAAQALGEARGATERAQVLARMLESGQTKMVRQNADGARVEESVVAHFKYELRAARTAMLEAEHTVEASLEAAS